MGRRTQTAHDSELDRVKAQSANPAARPTFCILADKLGGHCEWCPGWATGSTVRAAMPTSSMTSAWPGTWAVRASMQDPASVGARKLPAGLSAGWKQAPQRTCRYTRMPEKRSQTMVCLRVLFSPLYVPVTSPSQIAGRPVGLLCLLWTRIVDSNF